MSDKSNIATDVEIKVLDADELKQFVDDLVRRYYLKRNVSGPVEKE